MFLSNNVKLVFFLHYSITNGVHWYVLYGGMQDWNYLWLGDMEITIELSYNKWPDASDLPHFWKTNKQSLLDYINIVRTLGIRGVLKVKTQSFLYNLYCVCFVFCFCFLCIFFKKIILIWNQFSQYSLFRTLMMDLQLKLVFVTLMLTILVFFWCFES